MTRVRRSLCDSSLLLTGLLGGCMLLNPLDPAPDEQSGGGASSGGLVNAMGGEGGGGGDLGGTLSAGGSSATQKGGMPAVGAGGTEPLGGSAGQAGAGGAPILCTVNADCNGDGLPLSRCRLPEQSCVALESDHCRVVGDPSHPRALFFGAFASFGVSAAAQTMRETYEFALGELMQYGGLPPRDLRRPLVMVLCDNNSGSAVIDEAVRHLTEDVQVPAILAALSSADLQRSFEAHSNTFYLSPQTVTEELAASDTEGLVWNLLGRSADLVGIYVRVVAQLETYLRGLASSTDPIKVAVVTELADSEEYDLSTAVLGHLKINAKSFNDNELAGTALRVDLSNVEAVKRVIDFKPQLVISFAKARFSQAGGVAAQIEQALTPRPHYLLSPFNVGDAADLEQLFSGGSTVIGQTNRRFLGIDGVSALDGTSRDVKHDYESNLRGSYPGALLGFENYYDAVYYLVYAMLAGGAPITGRTTAFGMTQLYTGNPNNPSVKYYTGPGDLSTLFSLLPMRDPIYLMGAIGAPTFDSQGGRVDTGSIYCFDDTYHIQKGVIGYNPSDDTLYQNLPSLPCLTSFL
ncbi:MAG: hypothetical protein QM756_01710 [Polyangiaceae bacterium]